MRRRIPFPAAVVLLLSACAHHRVDPLEPPPTVPVSERIGGTEGTTRPSDRWLEARAELDALVEVCTAKRADLVDEVEHAERTEGWATAGAVGATVLGGISPSGQGPMEGPGPASYQPNYVYGSPAMGGVGAPTSAEAGAPFPESSHSCTDPTRGGPIAHRTDELQLDANRQVRAIDEEIDAAYEHLDSLRASPEFDEADEEAYAEHRDRLEQLCSRGR